MNQLTNSFTNSLTQDETNILCIYMQGTRVATMDAIVIMQHYLEEDETELREMSDGLLTKLEQMTDQDFSELDAYPDFDQC